MVVRSIERNRGEQEGVRLQARPVNDSLAAIERQVMVLASTTLYPVSEDQIGPSPGKREVMGLQRQAFYTFRERP
jgi:hypothetical protein